MIDSAKVEPEENIPPSVVDSDAIVNPFGEPISMSRIITVDLSTMAFDDPSDVLAFPVLVRDPNEQQPLEYLVGVDRPMAAGTAGIVYGDRLSDTGSFEREVRIQVSVADLGGPGCHRLELFVAGEFELASIDPVVPGDVDSGVWWVRVIDLANQEIDLATCPR